MATRTIVQMGDDTLRKKSFEVTNFDGKLAELIDDMTETMDKAEGVGLAAVQVGILRRIFVIRIDELYKEFVNPQIIKQSGKQYGDEGCLSVKGKRGKVERPLKVVVTAQDRYGNPFKFSALGFVARAICHEYDHLDGILYVDKAKDVTNV